MSLQLRMRSCQGALEEKKMNKSIDEQLDENREKEEQLLNILRLFDKDEDDAIESFQEDKKGIDLMSEGWKGVMARSFIQEADDARTAIHEKMRTLIGQQRDEMRRELERTRREREDLLEEKRRLENEQR